MLSLLATVSGLRQRISKERSNAPEVDKVDAPPGWYPDPSGSGQQRYWNGAAWTGDTDPAASPYLPVARPMPMAPSAFPGYPTGMQPYQVGYQPVGYQVSPKSPGLCVLISFFVPGVGSMVAGNTTIGVIILLGFIVSVVLTVILIGLVGMLGFWVWGMVDAYTAAQRWNMQHGIIS